jgi:hypothetical protein
MRRRPDAPFDLDPPSPTPSPRLGRTLLAFPARRHSRKRRAVIVRRIQIQERLKVRIEPP